jgi:exopolyphosphatase/guanosine-5'-triphosphate,3'-diphosphate pyrophosphatase
MQNLAEYSDAKVTGVRFSLAELKEAYGRLSRLSLEERRGIQGMQAGREDVIISGAAILVQAAQLLGFSALYVSAWDLLHATLALPVDGGS